MPTQLVQDNHANDVRVKTVYSGDVMITYIKHNITLEEFTQEMIAICRFLPDQVFTMKWVDEEGDPCTISTQLELDEALRLYELNRDSELTVHGELRPINKYWNVGAQLVPSLFVDLVFRASLINLNAVGYAWFTLCKYSTTVALKISTGMQLA
ncbi:Protein kinase C iota type [Papilio xuthus]|uniref:Protein kinase C iota type n=1 Tax=Papilio xuthus TaxID=66420 RepID=A0A194QFU8_PAPXU|nr:Protein kinase C iota type [Papilio xuthus]